MSATLDFFLDSNGKGALNGGSVAAGAFPTFYRNDNYKVRVRVVDTASGADAVLNSPSFKLGIGEIDKAPSSGAFQLTLAGPVTSGNIPYNATTTQVLNAVSGIAGNVTVTTYGTGGNGWVIQAVTNGSALSFGGVPYTLFPTSSVLISTKRNPGTDIKAEQIIQAVRSPVVFSDSFTSSSVTTDVSLTKTQDGSGSPTFKNETYLLKVGALAQGGGIVLGYGANSTTGVPVGSDPDVFAAALGAVTGIGLGNVSVESNGARSEYTISFVRALGLQDVTTALTLDTGGIIFAKLYETTVTMATSELDNVFGETDLTAKTLTLEIELTSSGNKTTLLQKPITVRRDLISTGAAVPSPQASFYTKAEADALFVEDSTANVDAANRKLKDSAGNTVINYGTGAISDATSTCLGFFGASPIGRPSGTNAVSNVISLGLIASSSTYGVLPSTVRTLTTTASLDFGSISQHDAHFANVTVTGAAANDIVLLGLPTVVCAPLVYNANVIAANTVCVGARNTDNNTVNSTAGTFRITVIGY